METFAVKIISSKPLILTLTLYIYIYIYLNITLVFLNDCKAAIFLRKNLLKKIYLFLPQRWLGKLDKVLHVSTFCSNDQICKLIHEISKKHHHWEYKHLWHTLLPYCMLLTVISRYESTPEYVLDIAYMCMHILWTKTAFFILKVA